MSDIGFCQAPWSGVVVHFSGAVFVCDSMTQSPNMQNMLLGNLHQQSLQDIWQGPKLHSIRAQVSSGQIQGLLCEDCDKLGTCNLYGDPQFGQANRTSVIQSTVAKSFNRLELGLTDLCNMKCTMCCLSRGEASPYFLPQKGMMDFEIAKRVIAEACELSDGPLNILLHWVGEPLIYPKIIELLEWMSQFDLILNLVTNGIKLSENIWLKLHQLRHPPCINISLNAFSKETYQQINQVNTMELVHRNIAALLDFRHQHQWQSTIIVSSVVLRENAKEMPDFVRFWQTELSPFGEVELGLNGRGTQQLQIQLLCELDHRDSPFYFRQVQRWCGITVLAQELQEYSTVDQIIWQRMTQDHHLLEIDQLIDVSDSSLLELLSFDLWHFSEIQKILQSRVHVMDDISADILQKWVFEYQWHFDDSFDFPKSNSILWSFLMPQRCISQTPLVEQSLTAKEIRYLTQMMILDRDKSIHTLQLLSQKSKKSVQYALSDAVIIDLGLGKNVVIQSQLEEWHWRCICILLAQQVDANIQIDLKIDAPHTPYGMMVACVAHRSSLDQVLQLCHSNLEDWFLRFIRRWAMRHRLRTVQELHLKDDLEGWLLLLTISVSAQKEELLMRQLIQYCQCHEIPSSLPQDLAETTKAKPHLLTQEGWRVLADLLWQQCKCPLLRLHSSQVLGSAVFQSQFRWTVSDQESLLQKLSFKTLADWQMEQIQELNAML